jgi:type I restriction enzyme S subunit
VCIGGSSGKTCFSEVDVSCNQQINTITSYHDIDYKYLDILLKSPHFQTSVWSTIKQGSTPILNKGKWASIPVPICSNLEQTAILQKVEALMQSCTVLEAEIKQCKIHATQLMQAVIKEAFEAENTSASP